jgi:hypothetical protein
MMAAQQAAETQTKRSDMRSPRLTPEQREEARKNEAAMRQQRLDREAAAKRETFEANMKSRNELLAKAQQLIDSTAGKVIDDMEFAVKREVAKKFLNCDEQLVEWQSKLMFNPAYSMEWCTEPMYIAFNWKYLALLVTKLSNGDGVLASVQYLADTLTGQLTTNCDPPTSTAPGYNAAMICQTRSRSYLLRYEINNWLALLK